MKRVLSASAACDQRDQFVELGYTIHMMSELRAWAADIRVHGADVNIWRENLGGQIGALREAMGDRQQAAGIDAII